MSLSVRPPPACSLAPRLPQHLESERHHDAGLLGDVDELTGIEHATVVVAPSREGFDTRHRAGGELDDRLVVHGDRALPDPDRQLIRELVGTAGCPHDRGVEELDAPATVLLGAVHRRVGLAHELLRLLILGAAERDAAADPYFQRRGPGRDGWALDRRADTLRDHEHLALAVDTVAQHDELVATEPGDRVGRPQRRLDAPRHVDQHDVTGIVAERVVDRLEVVDIEEQHPYDRRLPCRTGQCQADVVEQQRAVRQTGQRLVRGAVGELQLSFPALGDVVPDRRQPFDLTGRRELGHDRLPHVDDLAGRVVHRQLAAPLAETEQRRAHLLVVAVMRSWREDRVERHVRERGLVEPETFARGGVEILHLSARVRDTDQVLAGVGHEQQTGGDVVGGQTVREVRR